MSFDHDPRLTLLRLIACGGSTAARRQLLEHHNHPAGALSAGPRAWRAAGLSEAQIAALRQPDTDELNRGERWLAASDRHHLLGWHDPDYPPQLRRGPNPPLALFAAGDPALLWHPAVAVVGSRSPTPGGADHARDFAHAIAAAGFAVVSGLAAGIDTAAHAAALATGGLTVAVLGTGPDVPYPRSNRRLHEQIVERGVVVSEHAPGTQPRKEHFPSRNRILAGLSLGTLVIEAAERSGALITARQAAEAGREVFAVPGSIYNPLVRGCHRLIRDGACLVERADEVIAALAPQAAELAHDLRCRLDAPNSDRNAAVTQLRQPAGEVDPDYKRLWDALGFDPTGMDQLVVRTGLTPGELSSMLLVMELEGRVTAQHGRYFRNR